MKCPKCGSDYFGVREDDTCLSCGWHRVTVFDRITASPEVLAEKLVYCVPFVTVGGKGFDRWYSTLEPFDKDIYYYTKEKAIAATVAKLNEVGE